MAEELEVLVARAAAAVKSAGAREVYLFGSAARGEAGEDSDVDLAVAGLPPAVFFRAMGAARRILGRPVDMVDLDESNPFTEHLLASGSLRRVG